MRGYCICVIVVFDGGAFVAFFFPVVFDYGVSAGFLVLVFLYTFPSEAGVENLR